nr:hypothetical protein [Candidatus Sigynarchaeota archaeon]
MDLVKARFSDETLPPKIEKAIHMLKREKSLLFIEKDEHILRSVIKSQSHPGQLEYATSIDADGQYFCCSQNLNHCGGLRGSICKHIILALVASVKAGTGRGPELLGWVQRTVKVKPVLNKQEAADIFIRYKYALDGTIEWRPVELCPEDFMAF